MTAVMPATWNTPTDRSVVSTSSTVDGRAHGVHDIQRQVQIRQRDALGMAGTDVKMSTLGSLVDFGEDFVVGV
jgi:hypothetical protein